MADAATVPATVARQSSPLGNTATAGGSVTIIADLLTWGFACRDAGHLVTPDAPTIMQMAFGIALVAHAFKRLPFFRSKRQRASDAGAKPGDSK